MLHRGKSHELLRVTESLFSLDLVGLLKNLLQNTIVGFSRILNLPEMSGRETSPVMFALQLGAKSENMTGEDCTSLLQSKGQSVAS